MEMNSELLTKKEAYLAMFRFLERQYEMTSSDDIGSLLGGMQLLADGITADEGEWLEWLDAVRVVKNGYTGAQFRIEK